MDPPRKGLEKELIDTMIACQDEGTGRGRIACPPPDLVLRQFQQPGSLSAHLPYSSNQNQGSQPHHVDGRPSRQWWTSCCIDPRVGTGLQDRRGSRKKNQDDMGGQVRSLPAGDREVEALVGDMGQIKDHCGTVDE